MDIKSANRFPELEAQRVLLQQLSKDDAEFIHFMRSDSRVNEFLKRPRSGNLADAEFFIDQRHQDFFYKRGIYWAIRLKTNGFTIGAITLWKLDFDSATGELGYELHPSFQNKGYMKEAVAKVLEYGFTMLGLTRIIAITSPENEASLKLLNRYYFTKLPDEELSELDLENGSVGFQKVK